MVKKIGVRHREKTHETLLTKEELKQSKDYRDYFKSKENNDEENTVAVINILGPIIDGYQTSGAASGDRLKRYMQRVIRN